MLAHSHHLRDDGALSPVDTEHFRQLPQVLSGSLSDREDSITEPAHAEIAELLIEELDSQLTCQQGDIFDYCETNSPLLVFSQLDDSREKRLREEIDTDNYIAISVGTFGEGMPIAFLPLLTNSSLEMICRRTSGNSSLSICKNIGRRCAMVLERKCKQSNQTMPLNRWY